MPDPLALKVTFWPLAMVNVEGLKPSLLTAIVRSAGASPFDRTGLPPVDAEAEESLVGAALLAEADALESDEELPPHAASAGATTTTNPASRTTDRWEYDNFFMSILSLAANLALDDVSPSWVISARDNRSR